MLKINKSNGTFFLKVFWAELRRHFNIMHLLIALAAACMIFFTFMKYYTEMTNSHSSAEEFEISLEMVKKYGSEMDRDEFADFLTWREKYVADCEYWIQTDPIFAEAGIYSYEDYVEVHEKQNSMETEDDISPEQRDAIWRLFGAKCNYAWFYVQAYDMICEDYRFSLERAGDYSLINGMGDSRLYKRRLEIYSNDKYKSILTYYPTENLYSYAFWLSVVCLISVMISVCPTPVTDRISQVDILQRSSRFGRMISAAQISAAAASGLIISALETAAFVCIFLTGTNTWIFLKHSMDSFMLHFLTFRSETYGGIILKLSVGIIIISVAASVLTCILSSLSGSVVGMLLKVVPIFALLVAAESPIIERQGAFGNPLYNLTGITFAPELCIALIFAAAAVSAAFYIRHEMKKEY